MTALLFLFFFLNCPIVWGASPARTLFDKMVSEIKPNEWSQAREIEKIAQLEQDRLLSNPQVQLGFGTTNFTQFQGRYEEFSFSQTIPLNGRRRGLAEKIELQKKLSSLDQRQLEFEIEREILLRLFFHQMNKELAAHLKERLERFALIQQFLQKNKFVSPQDQVQRVQVQLRLKQLKIEIAEVRTRLTQTTQYFRPFCSSTCLNELSLSWPKAEKLTTIFEQAQQDQISFQKRLSLQKDWVEEEQKIAQTLWRPDIRLYGVRTYEGQPYQSAQVNQAIGVGLALPLFDRGQEQTRIAAAKAYNLEREQIHVKRQRLAETLALQQEFKKSLEVLKQFNKETQDDGEKILRVANRGFQKGLVPVGQFLDIDEQVHSGVTLELTTKFDLLRLCLELIDQNQSNVNLKDTFL